MSVLRNKRDATKYRILVEIAIRQPAISQSEIAEVIGITAQAVSDYFSDLLEDGFIVKHRRGRYEISKEGVDWVLSRTEELRAFTEYVDSNAVEQIDIEAAISLGSINKADRVSLVMQNGLLHAKPREDTDDKASAVALYSATKDDVVAITDFEGLLEYTPGAVTILTVPPVSTNPPPSLDFDVITQYESITDELAVAGVEAFAAVRCAGSKPTIQFGTAVAVQEAAIRGLDVLLVTVENQVSSHTDRLNVNNLNYEVVDLTPQNRE